MSHTVDALLFITERNGFYVNMKRSIAYTLAIIAVLVLVVWAINEYVEPFLPTGLINRVAPLFAIFLGVLAVLSQLKDVIELVGGHFSKSDEQLPTVKFESINLGGHHFSRRTNISLSMVIYDRSDRATHKIIITVPPNITANEIIRRVKKKKPSLLPEPDYSILSERPTDNLLEKSLISDGTTIVLHPREIKEDNKIGQLSNVEEEKIVFHRMSYHEELIIVGSSPEQLMNYIKESISSSLWFVHVNNNTIAYDVNPEKTKFYYPDIDNVDTYGIVFYGSKYDLEKRKGGILNRRNMANVPDMFTISILSAGLGDKTKLHVRYDTQIKELLELFDKFEKMLIDSKIFEIKSSKPQIFI